MIPVSKVMNIREYFEKFYLEESDVIKFEYERADDTITMIFCTSASHHFDLMTPDEKRKFSMEFPYEDTHKLTFCGVSDYERELTSINYKNIEKYEYLPGNDLVLVMYGVYNYILRNNYKFAAVLSGYGDISFHYTDLKIEFKKLLPKSVNGTYEDRLYFDMETGRIGQIPDLFGESFFNAGDVVHLKSGGPNMTVNSLTRKKNSNIANCSWFDSEEKLQTDNFLIEMLEISNQVAKIENSSNSGP